MTPSTEAVVAACDASYTVSGYRSFEFATFEVAAGEARVLVAAEHAPVRDMLLACAGLVRPTAGSLKVCGRELARSQGATARGMRGRCGAGLPRGAAGLGVFERVAAAPLELTVEETVAREARLRARRSAKDDTLSFLAELGLATCAEQRVESLEPDARARFSLALALAGAPQVAAVDLADPFLAGLSLAGARACIDAAVRYAAARGVAVVLGTTEPQAAAGAAGVVPLDIPSAEALCALKTADERLSVEVMAR